MEVLRGGPRRLRHAAPCVRIPAAALRQIAAPSFEQARDAYQRLAQGGYDLWRGWRDGAQRAIPLVGELPAQRIDGDRRELVGKARHQRLKVVSTAGTALGACQSAPGVAEGDVLAFSLAPGRLHQTQQAPLHSVCARQHVRADIPTERRFDGAIELPRQRAARRRRGLRAKARRSLA